MTSLILISYRSANRIGKAGRRLQATVKGDTHGVHIPGSKILSLTKADGQDQNQKGGFQ